MVNRIEAQVANLRVSDETLTKAVSEAQAIARSVREDRDVLEAEMNDEIFKFRDQIVQLMEPDAHCIANFGRTTYFI